MVAKLTDLSNVHLAQVFNAVTGQTVSRFTNVEVGRKRLDKALAEAKTDLLDAMDAAGLDPQREAPRTIVEESPDPMVRSGTRVNRQGFVVNASVPAADPERATKRGGRLEEVLGLLRREEGATVKDIMQATGWQPHTTRAYLSKGGAAGKAVTIMSERLELVADGPKVTVYWVR